MHDAGKEQRLLQFGRADGSLYGSLRLASEFRRVRESGSKVAGRSILMIIADSPDGSLKIGLSCSRKYSPSAVKRNRARRLLRESFRLVSSRLRPSHIVMAPRYRLENAGAAEVQREMIELLRKSGLWKEK